MRILSTCDDYLAVIRKSGVVDPERLEVFLQQLRTSHALPDKPKKLARSLIREGLLTCFQAEQFLLGKWRGFVVGKYRVIERIGVGGMGIVYLCEHMTMHRWVAVKVLSTDLAEDPWSRERFYREAQAAAALDHPNLVRAHDFDQDGNLQFLVMEYVDGTSLEKIVQRHGRMNLLRAVHYIRQAAFGLQHAHEAGLIHRDIKPGNLLLDRRGLIKILDLGLARFYHDQSEQPSNPSEASRMLGTADYLAPEQAISYHDVDIRADIYSLGATFYFLLTGRPPFAERSLAQKLIAHQTRQPQPIREIRPKVPRALEEIIARMMAKSPADRFQMPGEIAEALTAWTNKLIGPPPATEMPRLSPAALATARSVDNGQAGLGLNGTAPVRRPWQFIAPPAPVPAFAANGDKRASALETPTPYLRPGRETTHDGEVALVLSHAAEPQASVDDDHDPTLSWEELDVLPGNGVLPLDPDTSSTSLLSSLAARCGCVESAADQASDKSSATDASSSSLAARCKGLSEE
jgi:serine/threonine protein kinase